MSDGRRQIDNRLTVKTRLNCIKQTNAALFPDMSTSKLTTNQKASYYTCE